MEEQYREHYFVMIRIIILLILEIYIAFTQFASTGASVRALLLLALFLGVTASKELVGRRVQPVFLGAACIIMGVMLHTLGTAYALLGIYLCYELLEYFRPHLIWYGLPLMFAVMPGSRDGAVRLLVTAFVGLIYCQHIFVVEAYRKQMKEDTMVEQSLKHSMSRREHELKEEVKRGLLMAENQVLEEREALSQTLHDKLGHSINGSVYQLEAVKVLMETEPEASKKMIQAVIDQLRSGMDEIRAILRRERPKKDRLARIQLEKLCEDCKSRGVDAELIVEGTLGALPEKHLEIILDNAYEAVSNSMKYAECSRITIRVHVLNRMVRCSISDNGIGCKEVTDGMGISGMRKRMREVNGILDFEGEAGFTVNMLLPL